MKCIFIFLLCIFSINAFADYYPPSTAPYSRDADYSSTGRVCTGDGEWLEKTMGAEGHYVGFHCKSCPAGYFKGEVRDSSDNFLYYNCQQECQGGYKYLRGMCQTCPEIWKEWRVDNPDIGEQCLAKLCPANKMLDTKTGACVDFDPKCSQREMDTIYPPAQATFKAFCDNFCKKDPKLFKPGTPMEYRSANFDEPRFYACRPYPTCPMGQRLKITETRVKTTLYEDVSCETDCRADEFSVNGRCYQKCSKDEFFIDGNCTDKDPIVDSYNWFGWSISYTFTELSDFFSYYFEEFLELFNVFSNNLDDLDDAFENHVINSGSNDIPDSVDTSSMYADTPVKEFNFSDLLKIDLYTANAQCPADRTVMLLKTEYTFKYARLCTALDVLSKLLLALVFYFSATILWRDD
jgi:hypothetical protein